MKRSGMSRLLTRCLGLIALTVTLAAAPVDANALDRRDVIGGMSANAVMGIPDHYPAPAYYAAPLGPPPGCVIRQQRVWDGYRWRWRKLRICH
jgi:hypothetical protein